MNKKWHILLAFAAGIAIGMNWDKIKKIALPVIRKTGEKSLDACNTTIRFLAEQKERMEDERAAKKAQAKLIEGPV